MDQKFGREMTEYAKKIPVKNCWRLCDALGCFDFWLKETCSMSQVIWIPSRMRESGKRRSLEETKTCVSLAIPIINFLKVLQDLV